MTVYARLTSHGYRSWSAIPLRLIVGYGFMEHGYAKIARGPENYASILHALGMPAPASPSTNGSAAHRRQPDRASP
jgi:uncharacterized membrane protein YphA (DoxX/SURF4 family)